MENMSYYIGYEWKTEGACVTIVSGIAYFTRLVRIKLSHFHLFIVVYGLQYMQGTLCGRFSTKANSSCSHTVHENQLLSKTQHMYAIALTYPVQTSVQETL